MQRILNTKAPVASAVKGAWSEEEDDLLCKLISRHGARNWSVIANGIRGRSGKSCRLRWCNQLNPSVKKEPFSAEEDAKILEAHKIHGNKWAIIARSLEGRTDNSIKNHWNSTLKRRCGEQSHRTANDGSCYSLSSDETGDTPKSVLAVNKKRGGSFGKRAKVRSSFPQRPAQSHSPFPQASDASKKSKRSPPQAAVEEIKVHAHSEPAPPLRFADRHSFVSLTTYFGEPVGGFGEAPPEQLDMAGIIPGRGAGFAPPTRTDLPGAFDDLALRSDQADAFAFMRGMYDLDGFCVEPTLTLHDELGPGLSIFDL